MLQKLFRSKSTTKDLEDKASEALLEPEPYVQYSVTNANSSLMSNMKCFRWTLDPIDPDRIRVLLCQEGSDSNKFALYDSHNSSSSNETGSLRMHGDVSRSWNGSQLHTIASRANDVASSLAEGRRSTDFQSYSVKTLPAVSGHDSLSQQRKQYRKLDIIGDMIFGAAPLAYKGMSTKIHYKRDNQPQIILTNLFTINPRELENQPVRRGSFSSVNSDMSFSSSASSPYFDSQLFGPPLTHRPSMSRPQSIIDDSPELSSDDESSRYSSVSPMADQIFGRSPKPRRSLNSKRSRRFSQTSIEDGTFNPTPLPNTRTYDYIDPSTVRHPSRSIKYALAIVITLDNSENDPLLDLIFSHFAVIENKLHQLQAVAFKLLCNYFRRTSPRQMQLSGPNSIFTQPPRRSRGSLPFLSAHTFQNDLMLLDAVAKFKDSVCSLYNTPRVQEPLWLNMSTFSHRRPDYSYSLLRELTNLMDLYDNKAQNFLVSTTITAVLMYHLSWVPTIVPPEENRSRMARTIVVGQQPAIVRRIIYVLSYFIRCNEVYDNMEVLATDVDSGSIFGRDFNMDDANNEMEDHIVKQLMGSSESKSINIPRRRGNDSSYADDISVISSIDNNSLMAKAGTQKHTRSASNAQMPVDLDSAAQTNAVASAIAAASRELRQEKSLDEQSLPSSQSPSSNMLDSNLCYPLSMPKSYIYHMEPDITQAKEYGMPSAPADKLFAKSYGRSLMAGYCNSYKSDFVLMGLPNNSFIDALESDMQETLTQYSLSNATTEAVCVVIDTNTSRCRALQQRSFEVDQANEAESRKDEWRNIHMSNLVHQMLNDVKRKFQGGVSPEECICHLEDQMQLMYLRSTMLQEIVYQWRNGFNALDDRRFLSDPKLLAAEIRQVYPN
ncbi:hypothetical protein NQZ79_g5074 [Umbelopsis isabellina]|nr:hypothetical protein NQZ79_g5074 [Umbelopsis isabellina]